MSERLTIADSKKAFHSAFSHVIPPIYRRVTDELLVELHLLSHQKGFKPDVIFAIGLGKVFDTFTRGYRPAKHLESLFEALCKSNGFDPVLIREQSGKALEEIKDHSIEEIESWLKNNGTGAPKTLKPQLELLSAGDSHYSRLISIGMFTVLEQSIDNAEKKEDDITKLIIETFGIYGFSQNRVERDLNQYSSNLDKISQALELMKEAVDHDRKKKLKNLSNDSNNKDPINENSK